MNEIGVALLALLGPLAGAAFQWWSSRNTEERRWAREDVHRFSERRRLLYAEFSIAVNRYSSAVAAGVRGDEKNAATRDLLRTFNEVKLTSSRPVLNAATQVYAGTMALSEGGPQSAFSPEFVNALNSFESAARAELGIDDPS